MCTDDSNAEFFLYVFVDIHNISDFYKIYFYTIERNKNGKH